MEVGLAQLIDEGLAAHAEESRAFNAVVQATAGDQPQPDLSTPEGLRAARSQLSRRPPEPRAVERIARAGEREVPVRVITPVDGRARGAYLQIHGGGFYMDSAARSDSRNALLADAVRMAVVSVDYRLAPEHPWPAAPDDCETAALWLLEHAETLFGTARLMIGGASAGANLVMTTLLRLRDRGLVWPFAGAVLLPPALLVVGTLDVLLEDSLAMAARLSAAGSEVDLRVYPESPHAFTSFPTAMAAAALNGIDSWLAGRLNER